MSRDTIAAIATAPVPSAVGIVRVSGPLAASICTALTDQLPQPRSAALRVFRDRTGAAIDQGLVLYFPGPASFTGEDVVEFQGHGNPVVLTMLLRAIYDSGARAARPGEFTERAFRHGKIDLLQAESLADLIASGSERAARAAFAALQGTFSAELTVIADGLRALRAEIEATVDFPDETLTADETAALLSRINALRTDIVRLRRSAGHGVRLGHGIDAVIVGRPNVGKSTLLNALARDQKAIVSDEPGTTRDVLTVEVAIHGVPIRLHDTAGIREAASALENEGVIRARRAAAQAELILHVVEDESDFSELPSLLDAPLVTATIIRIHNKIDIAGSAPEAASIAGHPLIRLSAATGAGLGLLQDTIAESVGLAVTSDSPYLARSRHLFALEMAEAALAAATDVDIVVMPELVAERLRLAQQALEEMTGRMTTEDLLDDIFSRFCLGK